jgi:hypothetical protein
VASPRYRQLSVRVEDLRTRLLPRNFSPTGSYSPTSRDRARAFRVLVHAEFESFVEDRALDVVDCSLREWLASGKVKPCLLALVAYEAGEGWREASILDPGSLKKPSLDLEARIKSARDSYNRYVRMQNHGVKERNLLRMLLPLGVRESDIDRQWLAAMDAWATGRGELAHRSGKLQVLPDPKEEHQTALFLQEGLRDIDDLLDHL